MYARAYWRTAGYAPGSVYPTAGNSYYFIFGLAVESRTIPSSIRHRSVLDSSSSNTGQTSILKMGARHACG